MEFLTNHRLARLLQLLVLTVFITVGQGFFFVNTASAGFCRGVVQCGKLVDGICTDIVYHRGCPHANNGASCLANEPTCDYGCYIIDHGGQGGGCWWDTSTSPPPPTGCGGNQYWGCVAGSPSPVNFGCDSTCGGVSPCQPEEAEEGKGQLPDPPGRRPPSPESGG